jgi:predicted nucleic acid-binding protein
LIEGLVAPWSASRGALVLSRASLFKILIAEIVMEEVTRELSRRVIRDEADTYLLKELDVLLLKLKTERIPHATDSEFLHAAKLIDHHNDVPVLAAAIKARPDWLLTDNIRHFNAAVAKSTGMTIVTPDQFLKRAGTIFPL